MTSPFGRVLTLVAGAGLLWSIWLMLPAPLHLIAYFATAFAFTLPGWPLARWMAGDHADRLTRLILALPLGYFSGALTTDLLRLAGVGSPWAVLVACIILALALKLLTRGSQPGFVSLAPLSAGDRTALAVLWLATLAVVGPVFGRVGDMTASGLAYRAYFNADLFVHMTVVAEFAKGTSPLMNPFYPVEALPYYWTYFTLPGVFSQLRPLLPVDHGIMLTDTAMALVFISVGYLVGRALGASARATAAAWLVVLLASSFEGAFYLWDQYANGRPLSEFLETNIDAVTRWNWNLPGVDGFQRAMWWTPQHLMALTLALLLILTMTRVRRPGTVRAAVVEGTLLGGMLIVSSFNGVLLVGSYALAQIVILALDGGRGMGRWLLHRVIAGLIVIAFLGLTTGLGMVQQTPNAFLLGWNRYFLRGPWTFVLLSFGPALFLAPLGFRAALQASRHLVVTLLSIVAVITVVFLFVDLRGHENTQVTFRTGHLMYLCLALLLPFAIDHWRTQGRAASFALSGVLVLGSALAFPTVALDWYNARDISNVKMSPGNFPWTVHISPDDDLAAQWIHAVLPPTATVQTDALPRERYTWAYIPAFARRRMAVGNGLFTLNPTRYIPSMERVHAAYAEASAEDAHRAFRELGADYVFVGDLERRVNGDQVLKFALNPRLFEPVYWRGSVTIYRVIE